NGESDRRGGGSESRGVVGGSESVGGVGANDGECRSRFRGAATDADGATRHVCRASAADGDGGDLRRDGLLGERARERNWNSHGARRRSRVGEELSSGRGNEVGGDRCSPGTGCRVGTGGSAIK